MKTRIFCLLILSCLVAVTLTQDDDLIGVQDDVTDANTEAPPQEAAEPTVSASSAAAPVDGADADGAQGAAATATNAVATEAEVGAEATDGPLVTNAPDQVVDDGGGDVATQGPSAATHGPAETETVGPEDPIVVETGTTGADSGVTKVEKFEAAATTQTAEAATEAPLAGEEKTTVADSGVVAPVDGIDFTTEATEAETMRSWPADDPCSNHTMIKEDGRYYSSKAEEDRELSDKDLIEGWYGFTYKDEAAIITPICIKEQYCSTYMPYHMKDDTLPEIGETLETEICGPGKIAGETGCCLQPIPVQVRNCQTKYIFYLKPINLRRASVCIQLPEETVPAMYHAIPVEEEEIVVTTAEPRPTLPSIHYSKLNNLDGVVTVEFKFPEEYKETNYMVETFDPTFRKLVADKLNNMTDATVAPTIAANDESDVKEDDVVVVEPKLSTKAPTPRVPAIDSDAGLEGPEDMKRRRRDTDGHKYSDDDVKYVGPTPQTKKDVLQVACFVEDPATGVVPSEKLRKALEDLDDTNELNDEVGIPVEDVYEGLPKDALPAERLDDSDVWHRHRDLLIALIILSSICLLVIIVGVCCLKCRSSKGSWDREDEKVAMEGGHGKKRPIVHENPLPDSEIMRDEAPMVERENPAVTSNGGGQHISKKDDDNGWVVPIDELSKAEKEKPEVEDTKL